jgi:hypothetical protein
MAKKDAFHDSKWSKGGPNPIWNAEWETAWDAAQMTAEAAWKAAWAVKEDLISRAKEAIQAEKMSAEVIGQVLGKGVVLEFNTTHMRSVTGFIQNLTMRPLWDNFLQSVRLHAAPVSEILFVADLERWRSTLKKFAHASQW